jgi:hypothetical protein
MEEACAYAGIVCEVMAFHFACHSERSSYCDSNTNEVKNPVNRGRTLGLHTITGFFTALIVAFATISAVKNDILNDIL